MGGLHGLFLAQYNILRENGHTPSEAYNETVEELTQSLAPYLGEHGMDMLHAACSTTARRGALDWAPEFEKATRPVFERLYASVKDGTEARKALEYNGRPTYRQDLEKELEQVENSEIWQVGKVVRGLRPERISQEHA
jgi:ketol-acid reductoisomerase